MRIMKTHIFTVLLLASLFGMLTVAETAGAAISILAKGSSTRGNALQDTTPLGCWHMPDEGNTGAMSGPGVPVGTKLLVVVAASSGAANATAVFSYRAGSFAAAQDLTRVQTIPRKSGNEMVSIWYLENPTPGVIDGTQAGAMFTIQGTGSNPIPNSWYRSAAYFAMAGVDMESPVASFTNEAQPASPASLEQTAAQLPMGCFFVTGAVCRANSGGPVPFPAPALSGLLPVAGETGQLGSTLAYSISVRMDVMTPTDDTTSRSVSYSNGDNVVGACSMAIRPAGEVTVVEGEGESSVEGEGPVEGESPIEGEPQVTGDGEPPVEGEGGPTVDAATVQQLLADTFTQADANGDGNLSFKEAIAGIPALTQAVFDALDTNGDGYLSPDELGVDAGSDCAGCRGARSTWLGDAMTAMLGLIGLAMVAAAKKW